MIEANIFISYRRNDTRFSSRRLYDNLSRKFGQKRIFKDIDDIPIGANFKEVIENAVDSCQIMLVIIGKLWAEEKDEQGNSRLYNENDYVHIEIAKALKQVKRIIPVLIEDATMPQEDELPDTLKPLAYLQAIKLNDKSWDIDSAKLIKGIKKIMAENKPMPMKNKAIKIALITLLIFVAAFAGYYFLSKKSPGVENIPAYDYWLGDWIHYETWKGGIESKGVMTLNIPIPGDDKNKYSLIGESFDMDAKKSLITGDVTGDGMIFKGEWRNTVTGKGGTFQFEFKAPNSFSGYYTYEGNKIKNNWRGEKFRPELYYTHTIDNKYYGSIGLRNRILKEDVLERMYNDNKYHEDMDNLTLIEVLKNGKGINIINSERGWHKIITKYNGKFTVGYISGKFGPKEVKPEKRITVKPIEIN
jgi:hypothetical protein